ncbi:MAG: DNA repair protein RecO [Dokdonella sp.]|uniref:DNA repair protein RecO n=1 Tax=Dokdonella sp. TaxID=2291710 RepID=UPI0032661F66
MKRFEGQPAFLLHARAYRETSLLLDAFTREHGLVGMVARGVRRERSRLPRGLLQPLQPLLIGWVSRGDLGTLTGAEAASAPISLSGDVLLAAMYVNELVLRIMGRNDPHAESFAAYALCLSRLAEGLDMGWTLRRFERDLLADLGYALALTQTASGHAIEPERTYGYDPGEGAGAWNERSPFARVEGAALLGLDRDQRPSDAHLVQLRRLIRATIRHLIGGDLNTWALSSKRPLTDDRR